MMTERELLVDCLDRLNRSGVAYMLTGSMASNMWGIPRTTHDVDFVIALDSANVMAVVAAFDRDFFVQAASVHAALRPPYQFNAIDNRSALKVDFWVLRPEPFDQEMFRRRRSELLFGTPAWVATPEDVLLHKLLWSRMNPSERQLGDAAGVWQLQQNVIDREYLRSWGAKLGVDATLEKIMSGEIRPKQT